jgi:CII-binding regulator of phage lambda lysogenization HflD
LPDLNSTRDLNTQSSFQTFLPTQSTLNQNKKTDFDNLENQLSAEEALEKYNLAISKLKQKLEAEID